MSQSTTSTPEALEKPKTSNCYDMNFNGSAVASKAQQRNPQLAKPEK